MNIYYVFRSDDFCYPVVIYADYYIRNKNSGYCNFFKNDSVIVVFPLEDICDICKMEV